MTYKLITINILFTFCTSVKYCAFITLKYIKVAFIFFRHMIDVRVKFDEMDQTSNM